MRMVTYGDSIELRYDHGFKENGLPVEIFFKDLRNFTKTERGLYETNPFPSTTRRGNYREHGTKLLEYLRKYLPLKTSVRFLGAGSGTGVMDRDCRIVLSENGVAVDYRGADICRRSTNIARRYDDRHSLPNVASKFKRLNLLNIPTIRNEERNIPSEKRFLLGGNGEGFDVIQAWGVVHHTAHPYKVLQNLADLLNEEGLLRFGVYGDKGNEERRLQMERARTLTTNYENDLSARAEWATNWAKDPKSDFNPYLSVPHLVSKERDPKNGIDFAEEDIVDELFNHMECQFTLEELVRMVDDLGLEIRDITDFNNKSLDLDITKYTTDTDVITEYKRLAQNDKLITPEQAALLDNYIDNHFKETHLERETHPGYWFGVLAQKPKNRRTGDRRKSGRVTPRQWDRIS